MSSWDSEVHAATLAGVTTEAAFQLIAGGDMKIGMDAGEYGALHVKANTEGTDDVDVVVYCSDLDAPGDVPDAGQALAGSDWSLYNAIKISDADQDDEYQPIPISGHKHFAATCARDGSTDTPDCDMYYAKDGVSA